MFGLNSVLVSIFLKQLIYFDSKVVFIDMSSNKCLVSATIFFKGFKIINKK